MKARTKSALLLITTLVVGGLVGAVTTGAIVNNRLDQLEKMRRPGGFADKLIQVIEPTDEAQDAQIRAALDRSHERFEAIRRECRGLYVAHRDSMRADLAPVLTSDQQTRLDEWFSRDWRKRNGHRGRGGPDGRRDRSPRGEPR